MITGTQCRMARAALRLGVRELAQAAKVSPATVTRIESDLPANASTLLTIQAALEAAGVQFIPENGGGAGVRLRTPGAQAAAPGFAATIGVALDTLPEKAAPREVGSEDEARGGREVADE